jgi:metallo-beta-lactamase class B
MDFLMKRCPVTIAIILFFAFSAQAQVGRHYRVSPDIEVNRISPHAYVHVSYASLPEFGRFGSNGVILVDGDRALLFDTPVTDSLTALLVTWIADSLHAHVVGFAPNHWHNDCMGGLGYLQKCGIPSYACSQTIQIAKAKGLPVPDHGFADSLTLRVGGLTADCRYFGPAHAKDNIVVWIPSDSVLFAGCMAKEVQAKSLGNLSDADLAAWPRTMESVIRAFSSAKVVVPGHGAVGGREVLEHTMELLKAR